MAPVAASAHACQDGAMIEARDDRAEAGAHTGATAQRNPYQVALLVAGGFALVLAFMLWVVIVQLTDYLAYDTRAVAELTGWMLLLVGLGGTAFVGAIVIAGVSWSVRHPDASG